LFYVSFTSRFFEKVKSSGCAVSSYLSIAEASRVFALKEGEIQAAAVVHRSGLERFDI